MLKYTIFLWTWVWHKLVLTGWLYSFVPCLERWWWNDVFKYRYVEIQPMYIAPYYLEQMKKQASFQWVYWFLPILCAAARVSYLIMACHAQLKYGTRKKSYCMIPYFTKPAIKHTFIVLQNKIFVNIQKIIVLKNEICVIMAII